MITLGGTVCVRNGISLDYCFVETIKSLLPVCDQVVVCDGESTDGTWELLGQMAREEPTKLALCSYQWPDPKADIDFLVKWLNYARVHLRTDFNFSMDADEVVSERSYEEILRFKWETAPHWKTSLKCKRHNFWSGPYTLVPPGHCLGHEVIRIAPKDVWMPSDGSHPLGHEISQMARMSGIEIFHYGFLRERAAYFEKSRQLHTMFFGGLTDKRVIDAECTEGNWMEKIKDVEWADKLVPFKGQHPKIMHDWLRKRGWNYV